jgi:hypothetical protein
VALNFNQVGGSNQVYIMDLLGTNQFRAGVSVAEADAVSIYDPYGEKYYKYALNSRDSLWHKVAPTPNRWNYEGTNPAIMSGQGFWLISGSGFAETNYVTLAGQVVTTGSTTVNIDSGFQMLGNQYTTELVISNSVFANAVAGDTVLNADQISVYRNGVYYKYALNSRDNLWHKIAPSPNRWNYEGTNITISVGEGFWYQARSNSTWDLSVPYDLSK